MFVFEMNKFVFTSRDLLKLLDKVMTQRIRGMNKRKTAIRFSWNEIGSSIRNTSGGGMILWCNFKWFISLQFFLSPSPFLSILNAL